MQSPKDVRFTTDYIYPRLSQALSQDAAFEFRALEREIKSTNIAYLFGKALAKMHRKGMIHWYPHFGNVGMHQYPNGRWKVVIRDLDNVKKMAEMTPEQRFGFLMLDVAKAARGCFVRRFIKRGRNQANYRFHLYGLAHDFMRGYTGHDSKLLNNIAFALNDLLRSLAYGRGQVRMNVYDWANNHYNRSSRDFSEHIIAQHVPELG